MSKTTSKTNILSSQIKIPNYKKLFMFRSSNKVYEWSVKIIKNSETSYSINTLHGESGGKLVPHSKNITKGKAGRSILEQAILEANSKWKKKHDKDGYRETLKELEDTKSNKVDTKIKKVIRPMLASKFTMESLTKKSRAVKDQR